MGFFSNTMGRKYKIAMWSLFGIVILFIVAGLGGGEDEKEAVSTPTVANVVETKEEAQPQVAGDTDEGIKVTRVIDGDTFEIEGGQKIRLIGVDTPETVHPSKPVECMGKEASDKLKELIDGKSVRLEKDVSETDRYDRLLRYVYVGDTFVNDLLAREGFASAVSYPPDVKYQDQFREAEQSARNNKWGLWSDLCAEEEVVEATKAPAVAPAVLPAIDTKPTTPTTQTAPKTEPKTEPKKPTVNCSSNVYNCSDFNSCSEVMAVFNQCAGDPHGLDGDDDGVPCESLCG